MRMRYAVIAVICFVLIALLLLADGYFTYAYRAYGHSGCPCR